MAKFKIQCGAKEASYKIMQTVIYHLYAVQKQPNKIIYCL